MRSVIVAMSVSAPPIVPAGMAFATACSISHGATPSGNAVAASQLQRLGHLIGGPHHLDAARRTMARFAIEVLRAAAAR